MTCNTHREEIYITPITPYQNNSYYKLGAPAPDVLAVMTHESKSCVSCHEV